MNIGLPSFYFPLRGDEAQPFSQSLYFTSDGREYNLSAIVVFFLLQILGGHVGVPVILLTLCVTKGIKRHPMLVNFLVTWVIYSTSFCVLLYLGKQFGPEPNHGLCAIQASLIYGTAVMTPTAGLSFVLNLWFNLRDVTESRSVVTKHSLRNCSLIAAPYAAFIIFVVFTASYGATNPDLLSRNRYLFYCTINSKIVDVIPGMAALIMLTVVVFEGLVAYKLYRMHKAFANMKSKGGPPMHLIIRVGVFSTYSFLSIVACIAFWSKTGAELPYIVQASLPTAAFIIFGTQADLLEAWGITRLWNFLRRKPRVVQVTEMPKTRPLPGS